MSRSRSTFSRPVQGRRAGRSNLYSECKFSNWARYRPFHAEGYNLARDLRPAAFVGLDDGTRCAVYERPVHPAFVQPVTPDEVCGVLARLPAHFLRGLGSVVLLGGTAAQDRAARRGGVIRLGCYRGGRIELNAFPRRRLEYRIARRPAPHLVQEFEGAGAVYEPLAGGGWVRRFDAASLRAYYLFDVLIHEVGHHVDRRNEPRRTADAEAFAEAFVRQYGGRLRGRHR